MRVHLGEMCPKCLEGGLRAFQSSTLSAAQHRWDHKSLCIAL